jgi:hypothetical protein
VVSVLREVRDKGKQSILKEGGGSATEIALRTILKLKIIRNNTPVEEYNNGQN